MGILGVKCKFGYVNMFALKHIDSSDRRCKNIDKVNRGEYKWGKQRFAPKVKK